jgi:Family of unknown function (DUF5689)
MKIKNIIVVIAIATLLSSCVNDNFDTPMANCVSPDLVKNKEVSDIYSLANAAAVEYTNDDIIEAIITSSDEGGNFFKTLSLMATDGTRGFSISIDDYNMYTKKLQPGKKVYIKMKGLYYANPSSGTKGLAIGAKPTSTQTVDRISAFEYEKFIISTCTLVNEETIVKHLTLAQLNNDAYLNALVEVDNVEFESEGATYGNKPESDFDKNENITDGVTSFVTRTSKYSNFAGSILPSGRGKIRGVLTKFGSAYQLIIRNERDVKLNSPKVDYWPPIVGNAIVFSGTLNEPFTSYAVNLTNFPKYINDNKVSIKYWQLKQFPTTTAGNKYIEMSSFSSGSGFNAKTYFFIPVDFTAANTFTFKEEMRFYKGGTPLQVYYVKSADYTSGSEINLANFTNITTSFNSITYPAIEDSENAFNSAGIYSIPPTLTGNGYFVFEYTGTATLTSTVQIDDIVIN